MALTITRLHSEIRAEVSGVDLGAPLDAPTRHALSLALADHLALVFHGQTLTPDRFLAAASAFGPPMEQHYSQHNMPDFPLIGLVWHRNGQQPAEQWHTDHTNRERPPAATLLHGVEIPSEGGGTSVASMRAAYAHVSGRARRLERIGNMNALRRRAPLAWVPSPCFGPVPGDITCQTRRWPGLEANNAVFTVPAREPAASRSSVGECGARFATACPQCGTAPPARSQVLPRVRHADRLAAELAGNGSPPRRRTRRKHLAEKILTSKAALEGERKQVTVLFADLKGSMELLADRDPEEARKLLDPVLERMMEAVHRYEGTVNQVMGDGIMALFGAPLAHEDHAVRACYAALRMQESVQRYADEVRRAHGVPVQIRVGLNSGEVVVRSIGSDLRMDYTAVGQTTHLAARMEQLADAGLDPARARRRSQLAEGYVAGRRRSGPVPVKGLAEPVEVYELTGAGRARTRLQAAAARGLTRFVGRDAELEQLRRALEHAGARATARSSPSSASPASASRGSSTSSPTRTARRAGWSSKPARSPTARRRSYLPVIDLLKSLLPDRAIATTHREIREKVTGKLLTLDPALEPTLPALLALLDVPVEDAAVAGARSAAAPPADARRGQAPAAAREPGPAAAADLRGPALDRRRDPGAARQPGREPADRAAPAPGQLPAGVPARAGAARPTTPSSGSTRCRRESADELLHGAAGHRRRRSSRSSTS